MIPPGFSRKCASADISKLTALSEGAPRSPRPVIYSSCSPQALEMLSAAGRNSTEFKEQILSRAIAAPSRWCLRTTETIKYKQFNHGLPGSSLTSVACAEPSMRGRLEISLLSSRKRSGVSTWALVRDAGAASSRFRGLPEKNWFVGWL